MNHVNAIRADDLCDPKGKRKVIPHFLIQRKDPESQTSGLLAKRSDLGETHNDVEKAILVPIADNVQQFAFLPAKRKGIDHVPDHDAV
jgi:hypothetical protein